MKIKRVSEQEIEQNGILREGGWKTPIFKIEDGYILSCRSCGCKQTCVDDILVYSSRQEQQLIFYCQECGGSQRVELSVEIHVKAKPMVNFGVESEEVRRKRIKMMMGEWIDESEEGK